LYQNLANSHLWIMDNVATSQNWNKGCVTHYGLAISIKKYLKKAKEEELWKLNYISPCKNMIFKKIL